ncbi:NYN domain-containing protein [Chlorobaculum thiosulfatiphilum]|jgi:predicted RNA-binding protein with PIN domain|uniref:NYN domain-containing protein n=1 Tax=Chlorobaculum thiosulfatiphilum TaxID=115852 RepID=A0A5C4S7W1_CHLTI|nr:NYN domain-containing protein [Chlorobaculum thiosulfatiphilum]TNJ39546.1 NYN domain-containing protein [Chlorobaculum thiosulfatiphilum]
MASSYRETVIDGYNLIHKFSKPRDSAPMAKLRERLETMLARYRQKSRRHVILVYDGGSGPKPLTTAGAIDITFSGTVKSADRWIIDHVCSLGARASMTLVVSSDREIQRYSTAHGAKCIDSETFIDELAAMGIVIDESKRRNARSAGGISKSAPGPLSDKEVDYWLRLFDRKR